MAMSLNRFETPDRTGFDLARAAVFDSMADTWDERASQPPFEALAGLLDSVGIDGSVVLDIGSGTGVLLSALEGRNPKKWIACDLSKKMLEVLSAKYRGKVPGLELLLADAHSLPLEDNSVDVVICNGVYPHFRDKRRALLEIRRVLKPGGILAINHFVSRAKVNAIHSSSEAEILRGDLLPPASEVAELLASMGFAVTCCVDTDELYRVTAVLLKRPPSILLRGVTTGYDNQVVLDSIDFEVHRGESVAIFGKNGAGKTTLLKLILGIVKPWSGTIEIEGKQIQTEADRRWIRQRVGYVPQGSVPGKLPITVFDAVLLGRWGKSFAYLKRPDKQDYHTAARMLELVGMADLKERDCRELSGGQIQRLNIARALVREPDILLLDEPSTYLDKPSRAALAELMNEIRKRLELSIVVVSHDEDLSLKFADVAYKVDGTKIEPVWGEGR